MIRNALVVAALLPVLVPMSAAAQPRPNAPEWARGQREVRKDVNQARDDKRDLRRVEDLQARYDRASLDRNHRLMAQLEDDALAILRDEWAEGQEELAQDRRDVARSEHELRSDRRDLARENLQGDAGGAARERHELREDRRDLREKERDAAMEARSLERIRSIGDELWRLRGNFRRPEVARKRDLIAEMVQMARDELRQDRRQLREDVREHRDDRMERHDDRR
jgi:hypothetical protein